MFDLFSIHCYKEKFQILLLKKRKFIDILKNAQIDLL